MFFPFPSKQLFINTVPNSGVKKSLMSEENACKETHVRKMI